MSVDARKYNFIKIPSYMSNSSFPVLSLYSVPYTLLAKQDINIFCVVFNNDNNNHPTN